MAAMNRLDTPPGPSGLPFVGNLVAQKRDHFSFVTDCADEYGDVVYWEFLNTPIYQVNHPDDIQHILVENADNYVKGKLFQQFFGNVTGDGLLNSDGEKWRQRREAIQPSFKANEIQAYAETIGDVAARTVGEWPDHGTIDLHEEMTSITVEVVAKTLLGVDIREDIETIRHGLETVFERLDSVSFQLLPQWAPTPGNLKYRRAISDMEAVVERIVDERLADPSGTDVISRLIQSGREDDGTELSREALRDEVMTFLLAGHETTALALTYLFYLLAQHESCEARVRDELDTVLNGDRAGFMDVMQLSYCNDVFQETLRLYPPVTCIVRETVSEDTVNGYTLPAGTTVWLSQWAVHRDDRWYDAPETFDPSRWAGDQLESLPPFAYFPFGGGPRNCIGERFAKLEAILVLATVFQSCELTPADGTELELESAITARPKDPLKMNVRKY